jgi:membrane protease YdiL (CAAX protease family)
MLATKLVRYETTEASMLGTVDIILHSIVLLFIPLAIHSLVTRQLPPEGTFLGRLFRTDPNLIVVNGLFLLALCLASLYRLGIQLGVIGQDQVPALELMAHVPFMVLLVVFLAMIMRAMMRRRTQ